MPYIFLLYRKWGEKFLSLNTCQNWWSCTTEGLFKNISGGKPYEMMPLALHVYFHCLMKTAHWNCIGAKCSFTVQCSGHLASPVGRSSVVVKFPTLECTLSLLSSYLIVDRDSANQPMQHALKKCESASTFLCLSGGIMEPLFWGRPPLHTVFRIYIIEGVVKAYGLWRPGWETEPSPLSLLWGFSTIRFWLCTVYPNPF